MNNYFGISQKSYYLMIQTFAEFPEIDEVILFGSRALGTYHRGSDIDIAILGEKVNQKTVINLSGRLNESLPIPYKIDVVAPKFVDHPELIKHIKQAGVSIFTNNSTSTF